MSCRRVRRQLPLFVGGDLGEKAADRLTEHLDSCEPCRIEQARYDESRKVLFRLKQTGRGPAPNLWPGIQERIEALPVPTRGFPLRAVAAALLVAAMGATLLLTLVEDPPVVTKPGPVVAVQGAQETEGPAEAVLHQVVPVGLNAEPMFASVDIPDRDRFKWDQF